MRRLNVLGFLAVLAVAVPAGPAGAHTGWDPATAAPGGIIDLTLNVADEQDSGAISMVELQFPQPLTVVTLPAPAGWTATVVGGDLGGEATGVTWAGGPAPGDLQLPITLGPLPSQPGRLQFKAVQTYDNGAIDRWIDDWPAGAPEPEHPGPVLDLVAGGPGTIPASTTTTTAASTTTEAPTTTTPSGDDEAAAPDEQDDDDSDGSALPVVLGGLVVLAAAAGVFLYLRSRRAPGEAPGAG